jgi:DNA-binding Xre family transcriptional regulator
MERYTIPEWRRLRNYSQMQMASQLGVHENTYRRMEQNPMKVRLGDLLKICAILDVKISDVNLLCESESERGE